VEEVLPETPPPGLDAYTIDSPIGRRQGERSGGCGSAPNVITSVRITETQNGGNPVVSLKPSSTAGLILVLALKKDR